MIVLGAKRALEAVALEIYEHEVCTLIGKRRGYGLAEIAGRAGDDDGSIVKSPDSWFFSRVGMHGEFTLHFAMPAIAAMH